MQYFLGKWFDDLILFNGPLWDFEFNICHTTVTQSLNHKAVLANCTITTPQTLSLLLSLCLTLWAHNLVPVLIQIWYFFRNLQIQTYIQNLYNAKIVKRIWHSGTGWLNGKSGLEEDPCMQWVPRGWRGNRKCPRGKVTSNSWRSSQKICVGRTLRLWMEGSRWLVWTGKEDGQWGMFPGDQAGFKGDTITNRQLVIIAMNV